MKGIHEAKERLIGGLMMGGAGVIAVGFIFIILLIFLRTPLGYAGPFLVVIGIAMMVAAMIIGLSHNRSGARGTIRPQEEARVVARYAMNEIGEMIFSNFDMDAPGARFYVRLQYLDGKREELECGQPVFDQCGEGMRGLVMIQGGWMVQFTPLMDTDQTRAAYRGY